MLKFPLAILSHSGSKSIPAVDHNVALKEKSLLLSSFHHIFIEPHTSKSLELKLHFIASFEFLLSCKKFRGFFEIFIALPKSLDSKGVWKPAFFTFFKFAF